MSHDNLPVFTYTLIVTSVPDGKFKNKMVQLTLLELKRVLWAEFGLLLSCFPSPFVGHQVLSGCGIFYVVISRREVWK